MKKVLLGLAVVLTIALVLGGLVGVTTWSRNKTASEKPSWAEVEQRLESVFLTKDVSVREAYYNEYDATYKVEANGFTYLVRYQVRQIKDVPGMFFSWQYVSHTMIQS